MSQLLTMIDLTSDLVLQLATLADVPFAVASFTAAAKTHNWHLIPPEDWGTDDDPFLRIEVMRKCNPLIALWGKGQLAAIPVAVIFEDDVALELTDSTIDAFNSRFADCKRLCDTHLGGAVASGTYESQIQPFPLSFAYYPREHSTFLLLQHEEGDGHLGNSASLDIRIIPGHFDRIELPLKTNLIF